MQHLDLRTTAAISGVDRLRVAMARFTGMVAFLLATAAPSAGQTYTVEYTYDSQNRLTEAVYSDTTAIRFGYDPAGSIISVEIGAAAVGIEETVDLPAAFALHPPYPNPFRTRATLRFDVKEITHVRLVVYDVLGRRVSVLADERRARGRHEAVLDGRGLASGVYFCEIEMGAFQAVRQVLLVK